VCEGEREGGRKENIQKVKATANEKVSNYAKISNRKKINCFAKNKTTKNSKKKIQQKI